MEALSLMIVILTVLLSICMCLKRRYTYWQRRGLECLEPEIFYGNVRKMAKGQLSFGEQFKELYLELKAKGLKKHGGIYVFFSPIYIPLDPELIKCILQKDFDHFRNHGMYINEESDPLSGHLFNLEDSKWKNIRTKLTPTFTLGKMKMMFPTLAACSNGLEDLLMEYALIKDPLDVKDVLSRFTCDVIASCGFGLDCNSLKNPNAEFRRYGKKVIDGDFISRMKLLATMLVHRNILAKVGFKSISKDVESFFINVINDTVEYRKKSNVYRKDFIQLLLQVKNGEVTDKIKEDKGDFSTNEIAAQCFGFFVAGFETSATTVTFALYEVAANPEVQDKLRLEIVSVLERYENKLTYESIMEMAYLDKVIHETLRKYPPAPGTRRICNTRYNVPGTDLILEPGTQVHIPIMGIHHDPEYYPDPSKFDPERFSEENRAKRPAFTYLPFGEGPRICIGAKFGLLQSKVGLVSVIRSFRVTVNKKTPTPLKLDQKSFFLGVQKGIWLNISKVDQ